MAKPEASVSRVVGSKGSKCCRTGAVANALLKLAMVSAAESVRQNGLAQAALVVSACSGSAMSAKSGTYRQYELVMPRKDLSSLIVDGTG